MWQLLSILLLLILHATLGGKNVNSNDNHLFRIINGTQTSIEEIPWQVAHVVPQPNGIVKLVCSGSIISSNKIVTAGHCIKNAPASLLRRSFYRAGSSFYDEGGSIHHLHSYAVYFRYFAETGKRFFIQNDIAVVKVKEPFVYSSTVKPIALYHTMPRNFMKAQISGWGISNPYILNSTSSHLLRDNITVFRTYTCEDELGIDISSLPMSFFCLGEKQGGVGACFGDSGGPVTIKGKLVGVISLGTHTPTQEDAGKRYPCGFKISATLVQSVAPYLKWINDTIKALDGFQLTTTQI